MKWNMISTGDIALRKGGSVDPKKHQDEVFELYSIPAFDAGAPEVVAGSAVGSSKKAVQLNDVMISRIVPHIRRACVVGPAKGHRQIASGEWIIFRDERIWPKYLRWLLVGDVFHSAFMRTVSGVGGSLLRARPAEVFKIQIPFPPLDQQKRIAAILDAADALRTKRREALAELDILLQSTFLDMFGDPVTNPMGWESRHLPDLVSKRKHPLKRGPFGGALKKKIFVPEGFKVYEQKNVIYDDFDIGSYFIKKSDYERLVPFKVSSNNLLISCSGTIGRIAAVPLHAAPGVMNQALLKIDLDESIMLNSFFLGLWRSQSFEQQVLGMTHGTGMKNMKSMAELKGINFIVPPLDIQHRFAAIVESVEQQRAIQCAHLAELDTIFASLQSRAFRGDL